MSSAFFLLMADVARESLLRARPLLSSLVVRAYTILRACYDFYGPLTWPLLYYSLLYLAKVATRLADLGLTREGEMTPVPIKGQSLFPIFAHDSFEATTAIIVAILGVLLYVLLLGYRLLDNDFWRGIQSTSLRLGKASKTEEDNLSRFADEVPDKLLHIDVKSGLSKKEVLARQEAYGANEIWHSRNCDIGALPRIHQSASRGKYYIESDS